MRRHGTLSKAQVLWTHTWACNAAHRQHEGDEGRRVVGGGDGDRVCGGQREHHAGLRDGCWFRGRRCGQEHGYRHALRARHRYQGQGQTLATAKFCLSTIQPALPTPQVCDVDTAPATAESRQRRGIRAAAPTPLTSRIHAQAIAASGLVALPRLKGPGMKE